MPLTRLWLNGISMADYGVWASLPLGWGDIPARDDEVAPVPGHAGGLLLTYEGRTGPRDVVVEGIITSPAGALRAQWDAVKQILASPILEIRFEEWPDRVAWGRYQAGEMRPIPGHTPNTGAGFLLRFRLPNPYLQARSVDVYTVTAGERVAPVLGTAPSTVDLFLVGTGSTFPAVWYYDARGEVQGAVTFSLVDATGVDAVLPAGEWIHVDGTTLTMIHHRATGEVDNVATRFLSETLTDSRIATTFFVLDPQDGDATVRPSLRPLFCHLIAHVRKAYR